MDDTSVYGTYVQDGVTYHVRPHLTIGQMYVVYVMSTTTFEER